MNLRSLRIFRRIVTSGSLADASREIGISPSAASRLISLLEAELKLTLFNRTKRRLELTEEGDGFYRQTEHILRGLDEMGAVSAEIRRQTKNRLSLVTAAPIAMGLIAPALAAMSRAGLDFECILNVETRFDIESKVAARAYNFGIISLPVENSIIDLTIEPLLEARVSVLMPRGHPLAARDALTLEDIAREPFVALCKGQRWRDRLDDVFAAGGLKPRIVLETTSTPVAKHLVREGLGLTIADRVCGRVDVHEPLVLRPLAQERWTTYATIHPKGPRPALAAQFLLAMRDHIEAEQGANAEIAAETRLL